jgi:hypothetical protein
MSPCVEPNGDERLPFHVARCNATSFVLMDHECWPCSDRRRRIDEVKQAIREDREEQWARERALTNIRLLAMLRAQMAQLGIK